MINLCGNVLSFGASRTSFTYSAAPARRLSFAHPSLKVRSTFAQGSLGEIMNFEF